MKNPVWVRVLSVIMGFIAILASVVVLASPGLAIFTLLFLLSLALFFLGVARIAHSFAAKLWSKGHRALRAVGGVLAIILGALVLAFPELGTGTLVFLLAFALLVHGIVSLVVGGSGVAGLLSKWVRALLVIVGALCPILHHSHCVSGACSANTRGHAFGFIPLERR